jgi:hypothetical protein
MSRDFEAETDVKYTGLNGNCLTRKRKSKLAFIRKISSLALPAYWPRVNQPLDKFVLYSNCFLIVISILPSFRSNGLSVTFSIQLLTVLHYLH